MGIWEVCFSNSVLKEIATWKRQTSMRLKVGVILYTYVTQHRVWHKLSCQNVEWKGKCISKQNKNKTPKISDTEIINSTHYGFSTLKIKWRKQITRKIKFRRDELYSERIKFRKARLLEFPLPTQNQCFLFNIETMCFLLLKSSLPADYSSPE